MIDWGFIGNGEVDKKGKRKVTYFTFLHTPFYLLPFPELLPGTEQQRHRI